MLCGEGRDPLVRPETLVLGVETGPSRFLYTGIRISEKTATAFQSSIGCVLCVSGLV